MCINFRGFGGTVKRSYIKQVVTKDDLVKWSYIKQLVTKDDLDLVCIQETTTKIINQNRCFEVWESNDVECRHTIAENREGEFYECGTRISLGFLITRLTRVLSLHKAIGWTEM